jgi:hypothetical protein
LRIAQRLKSALLTLAISVQMIWKRGLYMRVRSFLASLACFAVLSLAASAAVRPEIGQPLMDALKLASAHDYKSALTRVDAADAVANKSDEETEIIEKIRTYLNCISGASCPETDHFGPP